jgi:uncharacterized membrane protein YkvA (DUF1232 family)
MDQLSDEQKSQSKQTFNRFVRNIHSVDPEEIKREAKDYLESVLNEREDVPDEVCEKLRIGKYFLTTYYPFDLEEPEDRVALAALKYLLDPWDGVSDVIPERGLADDAFILSFARKKIQNLKNKNLDDDAGQEVETHKQRETETEGDKGQRKDSVQDNPSKRQVLGEQEEMEEKDASNSQDGEGDHEPGSGDDTGRANPEGNEVTIAPDDRVWIRRELIQNGYEVVEANEDLSEVVWYHEQKDERIVGTEKAWDHYESEDEPAASAGSGEEEGEGMKQDEESLPANNDAESDGNSMLNRILSRITTQPSESVGESDENGETGLENDTASEPSKDPSNQSTTGTSNQREKEDGAPIDLDLEDNEQEGTGQTPDENAIEDDQDKDSDVEAEDAKADQESGDENEIEVDDIVDVHGEKRGKVKSAYSNYLEVRLSRSHVELYKRSECELVRRG